MTYSLLVTGKKLVIYSFILLMSNCKDTYDNTKAAANIQVPPLTETGANTFGCLVNGQPWANFGGMWQSGELGWGGVVPNKVTSALQVDSGVSVVYISAALTVSKAGTVTRQEFMTMIIPGSGFNMTGTHPLTSRDGLFSYENFTTGTGYSSLARSPFTVHILRDTIASVTGNYPNIVVSGTFNGMLYNHARTDSLRIVGGVFDVMF
jgi:hypothetical protein